MWQQPASQNAGKCAELKIALPILFAVLPQTKVSSICETVFRRKHKKRRMCKTYIVHYGNLIVVFQRKARLVVWMMNRFLFAEIKLNPTVRI